MYFDKMMVMDVAYMVGRHVIQIESIGSDQIESDRIDRIESIRPEMDLWTNFKLFRPKLSLNRTINGQVKWSKHKKLIFSAPERPRTVLNAFLECMYLAKNSGMCSTYSENSSIFSTFSTYSENSGIFSDRGFEPYFRVNFR